MHNLLLFFSVLLAFNQPIKNPDPESNKIDISNLKTTVRRIYPLEVLDKRTKTPPTGYTYLEKKEKAKSCKIKSEKQN